MNGHWISKHELGYHHFILFAGSGSVCSLGWALLWKILTLMVNQGHSKETGHIYIVYLMCNNIENWNALQTTKLDLNIPGVNIGLSSVTQFNPAKPLKVCIKCSKCWCLYRFRVMKKIWKAKIMTELSNLGCNPWLEWEQPEQRSSWSGKWCGSRVRWFSE